MDFIRIEDFRIEVLVGVYAWEQLAPQTLQMDLEIGLPATAFSGRLEDSIDYGAVVARIDASTQGRRFELLEMLAEHVAGLVRTEFGAPWVRVSVLKLNLLRRVKKVGVVIERGDIPPRQNG